MPEIISLLKPYILAFIPIFVAVNPPGLLPMYMFFTENISQKDKNKIIWQSLATALFVSIGFVFLGKGIFLLLGIRVSDFLVAGGILLFVIAINEILDGPRRKPKPKSHLLGVVPLGMPLMAGPAVLTTSLIIIDAHGVMPTLTGLFFNILLAGLIFKLADFFVKHIGITGLKAISKLACILLSAYGIMMIRRGIMEIISFWYK
ncbi:MAG: MarC family protein [bacterium]